MHLLRITGKPLHAAHYHQSPVCFRTVKSYVLLAGMYADGIPALLLVTENHEKIMLVCLAQM